MCPPPSSDAMQGDARESSRSVSWAVDQPLLASTRTMRRPVGPTTYSCVKLVAVRDGSVILSGEFGQRPINLGDVLLLGANVACKAEPEGRVALTTVYLDSGYAVDQFYWQHTGLLLGRLEAENIAAVMFSDPVQVLRVGESRLAQLVPWLDELVELSENENAQESFARMQALWFLIADTIRPFLKTVPIQEILADWARARPWALRSRRLAVPVRVEALRVRDALHANIARRWLLRDLAELVELSPHRLATVFAAAYGKTPAVYLQTLRVKKMAELLRESRLTVDAAAHRVGWASRSQAAAMFTRIMGTTPGRYRLYGPP